MVKQSCPYCHGKAGLNDTANSDFQVLIDASDSSYPVILVKHYDDDWDNTRAIAYCPMCGRRLTDEKQ